MLPGGGPAAAAGAAVTRLAPDGLLTRALCRLSAPLAAAPLAGEVAREPLPSSREVQRFTFGGNGVAVVGKFFSAYPPLTPADQGLAQEYDNYLQAAARGLANGGSRIPRLLGRHPESRLGLLLEAIPGPDLDGLIRRLPAFMAKMSLFCRAWQVWPNCWPSFTPAPCRKFRCRALKPWATWTNCGCNCTGWDC